jgi:hypothetical protein
MPNLGQLLSQIVRAAIFRGIWMAPPWLIWTIIGAAFAYAILFKH